tara:strand:- start:27 stop:350 length:324 start_codon:yes stop_codon:yes gene_type:complete
VGSKPVQLAPVARQEFVEAADYYEDKQVGLGDDFATCLEEALRRIGEAPKACAPVPGVGDEEIRRTSVRRFPYHLVFLDLPDEARVIAVAHERRRPGYWRSRIAKDD